MADREAVIVPVVVPKRVIASTLRSIRWAGRCGKERVVLWLGQRTGSGILVVQAHVPKQVAERDFFRIPPTSMRSLMRVLGSKNLMVAAQVHSHPAEAFHSEADDRWAIVRHLGALSLVLPYFARHTTVASFLRDAASFYLTAENSWERVEPAALGKYVEVAP
jgi:proteasome lid subunit RPN8/RPN11